MKYWLMKSEPSTFAIDDLEKAPNQITSWEGVRNYQARNFMRDDMKVGDQAFFYHSSCKTPGIVGTVKIIKEAYPDDTAHDPESKYFDPKSTTEKPRWFMVDIQLVEKFPTTLNLQTLKQQSDLQNLLILRPGNRLSITPVTQKEWNAIHALEGTVDESR